MCSCSGAQVSRLVEPTDAGSLLAERARRILQDVALAVVDAQLVGGGTLRVCVGDPSRLLARQILGAIRAEVPVHQTMVPWSEVASQLCSGELALALGPRVVGQGLDSELLPRRESW